MASEIDTILEPSDPVDPETGVVLTGADVEALALIWESAKAAEALALARRRQVEAEIIRRTEGQTTKTRRLTSIGWEVEVEAPGTTVAPGTWRDFDRGALRELRAWLLTASPLELAQAVEFVPTGDQEEDQRGLAYLRAEAVEWAERLLRVSEVKVDAKAWAKVRGATGSKLFLEVQRRLRAAEREPTAPPRVVVKRAGGAA